jgi:hypothetical protein
MGMTAVVSAATSMTPRAGADHGDGGPGPHAAVGHRADRHGQPFGPPGLPDGEPVRHHVQGALVRDGEPGHPAVAGHAAAGAQRGQALVGEPAPARGARPAGQRDRVDDDRLARLEAAHPRAGLGHRAGELVAEHHVAREDPRHGRGVQVGAADARGTDTDEHLSPAGLQLGPVLQGDLRVRRQDDGVHDRAAPGLEGRFWPGRRLSPRRAGVAD